MVFRDLRAVGLGLFPQRAEAFTVSAARELRAGSAPSGESKPVPLRRG